MKKRVLSFILAVSILFTMFTILPIVAKAQSGHCGENVTWTLDDNGTLTISGNGPMWNANVFGHGDSIDTVIIKNGVTAIGNRSFYSCNDMTSITIPDSITSIGSEAFSRCESLENVVLPNSIKSIGERAFYNCSRLTEITLPKGLTVIESDTFAMCNNLQNVVIPNSVTTIRKKAFRDCLRLCNITIPESISLIEAGAFYECGELKINVDKANKNYSSDENGVLFNKEKSRLVACHFFSLFSDEYEIPSSVKIVGSYAFSGCDFFKIKIPGTVEKIERSAFERAYITKITVDESNPNYSSDKNGVLFNKDKSKLVTFPRELDDAYTIPHGVSVIGDGAFSGCSSLLEVKIPAGVTSIGDYAFAGCRDLTSITIPDGVTKIGDAAFMECYELKSIEIPNGIKVIGDETFFGCLNLTSVNIPSSVISIGNYAFSDCECITELKIPSGVTSIGKGAFSGCSFSTAKIPEGVTVIRDETFLGCWNLTDVTIPAGVISIGNWAFSGCSFTELKIPAGVISIGEGAFDGCQYLKSIEIPDGVTKIGEGAFLSCEELKSIEIPEGVKEIGEDTFAHCWNLTDVTIPSSVTSIGNDAFIGCDSLTDVYYGGNEESWKKISVGKDNENLSNAKIHYINQKGIVLSATQINAFPGFCQSIFVYKADGVTSYDKSFRVKSSKSDVVSTSRSRKDNEIILSFNKISDGPITITVEATDGSGAKETCSVLVTEQIDPEDKKLLERLALSNFVYGDLVEGVTVKDQKVKKDNELKKGERRVNKNSPMFYLTKDEIKKWDEFYKKYIYDYKVIKTKNNTDSGFYGAAFEKTPDGDIIVAYRGTELKKDFYNDVIKTDGGMVLGILSEQFDDAVDFYNDVKKLCPDRNITLTGHSLGGALASYVAASRNVRCDNINGATCFIYNHGILEDSKNYLVDFEGFDKYVFEHLNGHDDLMNKAITRFRNFGSFNYNEYADSKNYNDKSEKIRPVALPYPMIGFWHDYIVELKKDYHGIGSIINHNNGEFALTEKIKEHAAEPDIQYGVHYIGTTANNTYVAPISKKNYPDSLPGSNQPAYKELPIAPPSQYVLAGDGDDNITLPEGGDDTLIGNAGNDILNGGAGNDIYVYGGEFGNDTIIDPSGNDRIIFTDVSLSNITISGNKIACGSNSIEISNKSKRTADFTIVDKDKKVKTIEFPKVDWYSLRRTVDVNTTKGIQIFGDATVEIYDAGEELIETIFVNKETEESVEYKDYGMVTFSPQAIGLTLPPDGYIIKIKSDETASAWAVSNADNPTVAKQTFIENQDLSDGSEIIINTGEMVEEQLSVRLVNGEIEESIYSETPETLDITANKSEIKAGETITMSVPETFANSVTWECSNNNAIITKNDDLSVSVMGYTPGEETVRAYLPNDELYSAEFSFKITQDLEPNVVVKCQDTAYDGETIATDSVFFDVAMAEGYDTIVFDTFSPYSQIEDTNTFVIKSVGDHFINVYCENSVTGARTKAFTFEFSQDNETPEIAGVEDEGVYYTDRVIEVLDTELDTIYINGELCEEESFIISEVGSYTIIATDMAGNTISISFELRDMLSASNLSLSDAETVYRIRNDFEEIKYSLSEERMIALETEISNLEEAINKLYAAVRMSIFIDEKYESNALINLSIVNAPEDAIVYIASYDSFGRLLELQKPNLKDGIAKETFSLTNVFKYVAFVWNSNLVPLTKSAECYMQ